MSTILVLACLSLSGDLPGGDPPSPPARGDGDKPVEAVRGGPGAGGHRRS